MKNNVLGRILTKYKHIFIFLLICSHSRSYCENKQARVDSLQSCLKAAKDDSTRATIFREIGLAYVNNGSYAKGIECFLKSKDLFQTFKNDNGIFRCECNLGVTYCYMNDYKTALGYLLNAKRGVEDGLVYDNLGLVYYNKNDIPKALSYWKMALKFYQEKSDIKLVTRLLNDIGSIYELQGEADTAISYYNECLRTSNDKMNLSGSYASLGDIYFKQKKYLLAIKYENKSLELAREINNLISVRETERVLSDIYLKINDCESSLVHYKNYIAIKDTLVNEDNIKQIVRIEENSKFEKEKELVKAEQDKKDIITTQEKKRQRIFIYSIGSVLFLLLLLAMFIYKAYMQKQKDNVKILEQKKIVDEKNKDILDSIHYASRIQKAILPPEHLTVEILPEHFIYFQPKDIVSGDFYIVEQGNGKIFWASCDATGHGTSGSLLSILGTNILAGIIKDGCLIPSMILDKLNTKINESLHKTGDNSIRDGMDVSLCSFDKNTMTLNYSGANNPVWIIRGGEIIEYKADKMPIGQMYKSAFYTNHEIKLQINDCIYSFSDGICDLHSEQNKKFMKKRFRELLLSLQDKSMLEQKNIITGVLEQWKGKAEQTDDMLLIGIKI